MADVRIVYLAYVSPLDPTGVPEKIVAWVRSLRELAEVSLLWVTHDPSARVRSDADTGLVITAESRVGRLLASVSSGATLLTRVQRELSVLKPDVTYLRHPLYRPGLAKALQSVAPYVMEINGNPYPELVLQRRIGVALLDKVLGGALFRGATGFVGVTRESVLYAESRARRPSVVIANGVDCDEVGFLAHRAFGAEIHVAYVGSPSVYDGLDRLWAALLSNRALATRIVFHIIGPGWKNDRRLRRVADVTQVRIYGYVRPQDLPDILAGVDIAIGPLGLHRRGVREASNLKVRRYLAHGIPVVLSADDPDLEGPLPFVLRVGADDQPLDVGALLEFGMRARNLELRTQARQYAETNLSYRVKARRLVDFMKTLIGVG